MVQPTLMLSLPSPVCIQVGASGHGQPAMHLCQVWVSGRAAICCPWPSALIPPGFRVFQEDLLVFSTRLKPVLV